MLPTQQSLSNFYQSVYFHDPELAEDMANDINTVAIWGLGADKSGGQEAATRLRKSACSLPVVLSMILNNTLNEMGYS